MDNEARRKPFQWYIQLKHFRLLVGKDASRLADTSVAGVMVYKLVEGPLGSTYMIYSLSRISVSIIFFYHGLVPKILFGNAQEIMMNNEFMPFLSEQVALYSSGVFEILYAISLLVFFNNKWLVVPAIVFPIVATAAIFFALPELFHNAFNPFSTNLSLLVLALINFKAFSETEKI